MNGKQWVPALVTVTLVGGAACQRTPQAAPATVEARPGAAPPPAESWRSFEPPADGRLTAAQVELYIAVRRQAAASSGDSPARDATAAGQLADFAASERRAANLRGQDVDEYRWVSARVAEASRPAPEGLGGLAGAIEAAARKSREQVLEKAAQERLPVAPAQPVPDDSARAYNRDMLDRYRSELDALRPIPAPPSPPARPPKS